MKITIVKKTTVSADREKICPWILDPPICQKSA